MTLTHGESPCAPVVRKGSQICPCGRVGDRARPRRLPEGRWPKESILLPRWPNAVQRGRTAPVLVALRDRKQTSRRTQPYGVPRAVAPVLIGLADSWNSRGAVR